MGAHKRATILILMATFCRACFPDTQDTILDQRPKR